MFPSQRLHLAVPTDPEEKPSKVLAHDASKSLLPDEIELPGADKDAVLELQRGLTSDERKKLLIPSNIYRAEDDLTRTKRSCDACGRTAEKPQVSHTCPTYFLSRSLPPP